MADTGRKTDPPLAWSRAAAAALVALAIILVLAVALNVAIGRRIHWDIVAALAGAGFAGLTLAFRYAR